MTLESGPAVNNKGLRDQFLKELKAFYPSEKAHGLEHALDVEKRVIEVWEIARQEGELRGEELVVNLLVLRLAALAHDLGYTAEERMLTPERFEHQPEGMKIINKILRENPHLFLEKSEKVGIMLLIFNHDNTSYSYPSSTKKGKPFLTPGEILRREAVVAQQGFLPELMILREADSFFGTGEIGLQRTLEVAAREDSPFFAKGDNPLQAEMWGLSIVGNLRLAARRAYEDAFTQEGKKLAIDGWRVYEEEILQRCRQEGIEYALDPVLLEMMRESSSEELANQFS